MEDNKKSAADNSTAYAYSILLNQMKRLDSIAESAAIDDLIEISKAMCEIANVLFN